MTGFVYIWYDRKHKRFYVGSHWGPENDGYICSSRWMRKAYNRRTDDFKRRVIAKVSTNRKDLLLEEQRWLDMMRDHEIKGPRYYNMMKHAKELWSTNEERAKTIRERIAIATKAAMNTSEGKQANLEGMARRNKAWTEERRERQRTTMKATMRKKFGPPKEVPLEKRRGPRGPYKKKVAS